MSAKKRGLGRGLSALIPNEPIEEVISQETEKEGIINIDISLISPNRNQPRKEFDKTALNELKHSIENYGVIQPIIVRKAGTKYEIVAGERRWKASKEAGLKEIPCIVKNVEGLEATKLSLIENIQREDLNPIEEAIAFQELIKNYGFTQEEVSQIIGKSRSYIANTIRLLNLNEKVMDYVVDGKISSGHGRALLAIDDENDQVDVAKNIINKKLNVRETEELVKKTKESKANRKPSKKTEKAKEEDPFFIEIEENLMNTLGTKVSISSGKNKGVIEIEYYGDEDLERILELIIN